MRDHATTAAQAAVPARDARPEARWERLFQELVPALRATAVTLVLTGLAYPLAMTGLAQLLFPRAANGSLVADAAGRVVGSELLAQGFGSPAYFQARPSAAGEQGYDPTASSGSNLGPTSARLRERSAALLDALTRENPEASGPPPVELITASGSGLDPHLSPAAALWQVPRVARARGIAPARIKAVMDDVAEGRDLGVLGEPRVNVLLLNRTIDVRFGHPVARRDEAIRGGAAPAP